MKPISHIHLAPAKLNLFLHITGRRLDSYHLLQSIFVPIDWCDQLRFEPRTDGQIIRVDAANTAAQPLPAVDLSIRAAQLLRQHIGDATLGCTICLDKHIPTQAGMGGGSSDAATTLMALNTIWNAGLSVETLSQIGLQLGADVPFFIHESSCWVEGVGEQITPLTAQQAKRLPSHFLVLKPPQGVSTPAVFSHPALMRDTKQVTIEGFLAWQQANTEGLYGHNDLQAAAEDLNPQIIQAIDWLKGLGLKGRMTGSGSAVFAVLPPDFTPAAIDATPLPEGWIYKVCKRLS